MKAKQQIIQSIENSSLPVGMDGGYYYYAIEHLGVPGL